MIGKLFTVILQFEGIFSKRNFSEKSHQVKLLKNCQVCKYRLAFYNHDTKNQGTLYYRCQITRRQVSPNYCCRDFVFDPQTFNV